MLKTSKGLEYCQQIDPWLAAHLADILNKINLAPDDKVSGFSTELREFYLLNFVEILISDPILWQLGFAYLNHCEILGESYL